MPRASSNGARRPNVVRSAAENAPKKKRNHATDATLAGMQGLIMTKRRSSTTRLVSAKTPEQLLALSQELIRPLIADGLIMIMTKRRGSTTRLVSAKTPEQLLGLGQEHIRPLIAVIDRLNEAGAEDELRVIHKQLTRLVFRAQPLPPAATDASNDSKTTL